MCDGQFSFQPAAPAIINFILSFTAVVLARIETANTHIVNEHDIRNKTKKSARTQSLSKAQSDETFEPV